MCALKLNTAIVSGILRHDEQDALDKGLQQYDPGELERR